MNTNLPDTIRTQDAFTGVLAHVIEAGYSSLHLPTDLTKAAYARELQGALSEAAYVLGLPQGDKAATAIYSQWATEAGWVWSR